jgi:type I restriction enzyme, S subunit
MGNWKEYLLLENPEYFDFGNGLWTGKKPPFQSVIVIRNTNFTSNGQIDYSDVAILNVEKKQFEQRRLIPGDIIIERSGGGPKQPVGRVVYFDKKDGDYSFSNFTSRIRIINRALDSNFVFYFLMYFYDSGKTYELQAQTTGIRNLDFSKYKSSVQIPLIPISEQQKIVLILFTIQKAIEQQDKIIRTTTELKKALMQKLFTEGTKGEKQKQTEIGLVPESWKVVKLRDVINKTQYGLSTKGNEKGHVPILRMTNQKDGYIVTDNLQFVNISSAEINKFKLDIDDIIFNRTNSYELVGRTSIFTLEGNYVFASYLIRLKTDKKQLLPSFLNSYLNTDDTQLRLKSIATRGVSQSNISATRLSEFIIPLPPIPIQSEIVTISNILDTKKLYHKKTHQSLTNLFKSLLHELMTGQRRVNEIDFGPIVKKYQNAEQPLRMAAEK